MHVKHKKRIAVAGGAVLGVGALATVLVWRARRGKLGEPIVTAMTINKAPDEVYQQFRDFERLPEFMRYLGSDAQIIEDIPGRMIAWRSTTKTMPMRGRVTFAEAPQRRGTEMIVEIQVPGIAKPFTAPELTGDMRRFKQVVELGEVVR